MKRIVTPNYDVRILPDFDTSDQMVDIGKFCGGNGDSFQSFQNRQTGSDKAAELKQSVLQFHNRMVGHDGKRNAVVVKDFSGFEFFVLDFRF